MKPPCIFKYVQVYSAHLRVHIQLTFLFHTVQHHICSTEFPFDPPTQSVTYLYCRRAMPPQICLWLKFVQVYNAEHMYMCCAYI